MELFKKIKKKRKASRYGWHGDYPSWEAAAAETAGYGSDGILERVRQAALSVRNGDAVFERDSVLFDRPDYNWPLLANLNWVAARSGGTLNVLDFGGALGSTWFQNRQFLEAFNVTWSIVEQPHFVAAGQRDLADDRLHFAASIEDVLAARTPGLFLASGVMQYLEEPAVVLDALRKHDFRFVIFDRTATTTRRTSRITVQRVPPEIYPASYPARFLSDRDLLVPLAEHYRILSEWKSYWDRTKLEDCPFSGYLLERRQA